MRHHNDSCGRVIAGPPKVLHYGNDLGVNNITYYEFDKVKLKERGFNPFECPPWKKQEGKFTTGVLPFPPSPMSFESKASNSLPGTHASLTRWTVALAGSRSIRCVGETFPALT